MRRKLRKPQQHRWDSKVFLTIIQELVNELDISKEELQQVIKDALLSVLRKKHGRDRDKDKSAGSFAIIVDLKRGEIQILYERVVVPDLEIEDEAKEIPLSEARKISDDYRVGEKVVKEIPLSSFGRNDLTRFKQSLFSKIQNLKNEAKYQKYKKLEGTIIQAEVYQTFEGKREGDKRGILLRHIQNEIFLPAQKMAPGEMDKLKRKKFILVLIERVEKTPSGPKIYATRKDALFVRKLLEKEITEIYDGSIRIECVVRYSGYRTKVAVSSVDDIVDPVGICVGVKGSRIKPIVKELHGEKIDIIPYTKNISLLIQRALVPAKTTKVRLYSDKNIAIAYMPQEEIRRAVGEKGTNIKLAASLIRQSFNLANFEIKAYPEDYQGPTLIEDIPLSEFESDFSEHFSKEFTQELLKNAQAVKINSATELLERPDDELMTTLNITLEQLKEIKKILSKELEKKE